MINIDQRKTLSEKDDNPFWLWDGYAKSIIENVNVWINVYDQHLNLILWNPMAEKISGYTHEEVLGHTKVWDWLYPDTTYRDMIMTRAADLLIGKATVNDWETHILCKNGNLKNIIWNSRTFYNELGHFQGAITFGYDITDRKENELALKKAHEDLSVLYNVASITSASIDLGVILERSLVQVLPVLKASKGIIHLWQEDLKEFHMAAHQGFSDESILALTSLSVDDGIIGRVFQKEKPIYIPSLITELENTPNTLPRQLFHAYLGVPMRAKGRVCGVFSIFGKADQHFTKYVIALLSSISDQIGVAVENIRLYQQLRQLAVSEERRRLARELHDAVTQSLYSLTLFAEAGQRSLHTGNLEDVSTYLAELAQTAHNALNEMRVLLHELRPLALETESLLEAIQHRLDAVERKVGIKAYLVAEHGMKLPSFVEQEIYRIIQESLNNTLRHASAQTVSVNIQTSGNLLTVKIADDGVGFDYKTVSQKGGIGLESMHERARRLDGELQVISAVGEGVTITLKVALDKWEKEKSSSGKHGVSRVTKNPSSDC